MLCFVDQILQRREKTVRKQMELWASSQKPSPSRKVWGALTRQQKQDITAALANLISKMVLPASTDQEESHER
jgi:hypothetical protein